MPLNPNTASSKPNLLYKIVPALVILSATLGILLWQLSIFQTHQAKIHAEETTDVQWRNATKTERDMAIKTVTAHLAALSKSDYKKAMQFLTDVHRGSFRSLTEFRHTMQKNYPQFDKNKTATFGLAQTGKTERIMRMQISVSGHDGSTASAIYEMIYENEQWLIAGLDGGKAGPKPSSKSITKDISS